MDSTKLNSLFNSLREQIEKQKKNIESLQEEIIESENKIEEILDVLDLISNTKDELENELLNEVKHYEELIEVKKRKKLNQKFITSSDILNKVQDYLEKEKQQKTEQEIIDDIKNKIIEDFKADLSVQLALRKCNFEVELGKAKYQAWETPSEAKRHEEYRIKLEELEFIKKIIDNK